jgi:hydroxyquinol 1,2-dioxygenase
MEEWSVGIDFLTRTGQMCSATRQEFILLSDVLGVSMLVDMINHGVGGPVTETTVLGPFYVDDPPECALGSDLSNGAVGPPLLVDCTVATTNGSPVAGAIIDTWRSDAEGYYDVQRSDELSLRGRFRTGVEGRVWFWSVVPSSYPVPADGPVGEMLVAQGRHPYRPAHVHFRIGAPGHRELVTHLFVAGDPYLDSDVVFGVKDSLIRDYERCPPGQTLDGRVLETPYARLRYDFVLAQADA